MIKQDGVNYLQKALTRINVFKDSLWPAGRSDVMPSGNTMESAQNFGLPYVNYIVFDNHAEWHQLRGLKSLMDWFYSNPVLYAVIMIKARESANMRIKVRNINTKEIEPENTKQAIPAQIYKIFNNPNVLQSRWEFFQQRKIFREATGNAFVYGNFSFGMKKDINSLSALWAPWPQYMEFKLAGKYFSATDIKEIIAGWKFNFNNNEEVWDADEVMLSNMPNLDPRNGLIFGSATALSLVQPLTNIDLAYESRNVIIKNRGMRAIITSDKSDDSGNIPLTKPEKESVQSELKEYGTLDGQKQFFFSDKPLKAVPIDQDVMKLGLFEEIATDAMLVCNAFGVPEILLKLYLEGATFENQEASLKRLYQGTIIPEAEDDMNSFNSFLGLDKTEWRIEACFDHITFLQKDKKAEAAANGAVSKYMETLFMKGAVTHNEWLRELALKEYPEGDKRIFDFTPEQIAIILAKPIVEEPEKDEKDDKNSGKKFNLDIKDIPSFGFRRN